MKDKNDILATRIMLSILVTGTVIAFFYYTELNRVRLYDYRKDMERYISEKYPEHNFYIDSLIFDKKQGYFVAEVKLKPESDRNFNIVIYPKRRLKKIMKYRSEGAKFEEKDEYEYELDNLELTANHYKVDDEERTVIFKLYDNEYIYDNYERTVLSGDNTFERLYLEYGDFVEDSIRNRFSMPVQEATGWLSGEDSRKGAERISPNRIILDELIPDKKYNVSELGRENGTISISFVSSREETPELLAKMLLEVKDYCDREKIYFYEIYLDINDSDCQVDAFKYEDIYEEGLVDRVKKNMETAW